MQVQMNDVTLLGSFFRGVPRYDRGSVSNDTQKQLVATAVPALQQTPPGASSDIFTQCTDIKALAAASGRARVAWFTAIPSEPPACQASAPNNVVSTPLPLCANRCGPDAEAKWTLWRQHFGMHALAPGAKIVEQVLPWQCGYNSPVTSTAVGVSLASTAPHEPTVACCSCGRG